MEMPPECRKYRPREDLLVGNVLRKRVRGEPLDRATTASIREAVVYGHDPARLTALYPPTNRGPHEWFFFSPCKAKGTTAHRRGNGFNSRRKERTVRDAAGAELGHWRSTQAIKDVIQIDASGCGAVTIGYHQNFEFRDSKKQKSDWLMEEYGILPFSSRAEAAGRDGQELVVCKIYKTPAARRAEAKQSAAPATLPPRAPTQPYPRSQPEPSLQCHPRLEPQPSPPPWSALPPLLPASWPSLLLSQMPPTSWPEQPLQSLPPPPEFGMLSWPPQHELMAPRLISVQPHVPWHHSMTAASIRAPFCPLDRDRPDVPHGAVVRPELYEAVAPFTSSPVSKQWAAAEIEPLANLRGPVDHPATYVGGGDQMQTTSQIPSQCTMMDVSDRHRYDGTVLLLQSGRQQQQQQHAESTASATEHLEGSATPDVQPAAAGAEDPGEQPPVPSDHAHKPDEWFYMIDDDGSLSADVPTIDVDDYVISDDFYFLDTLL